MCFMSRIRGRWFLTFLYLFFILHVISHDFVAVRGCLRHYLPGRKGSAGLSLALSPRAQRQCGDTTCPSRTKVVPPSRQSLRQIFCLAGGTDLGQVLSPSETKNCLRICLRLERRQKFVSGFVSAWNGDKNLSPGLSPRGTTFLRRRTNLFKV